MEATEAVDVDPAKLGDLARACPELPLRRVAGEVRVAERLDLVLGERAEPTALRPPEERRPVALTEL
jgi:hypothetical protein